MPKRKKHKPNGNRAGPRPVHVEFMHPTARTVAIAGTFNEWRPEATQMVAMGEGRWLKDLVLPPGTYEYLFVAEGHWIADPNAKASVPNPFGGVNSLLRVAGA
jgi:5'-AMP-activated protein kinase regulatory beta subunit